MTLGDGERPAFQGLDRIGRPEDQEIGDGAQRRQMLDGLMGRPILAQADGIMGHHIDDPLAHQCGEADRRPAIIGEDEEGPAIGDEAAMERDAVHRRGHAMLAHAIIDIAAGIIGRAHRRHVLGLGIVRAGEIGRAADELGQHRHQPLQHVLRGLAGGQLRRLGDEAALQPRDRGLEAFGQNALDAAVEFLMLGIGGVAADPFVMEGGPALAETAPGRRDRLRISEGSACQPSFWRAPATSLPRAEPWVAAVPALVGAP